MSTAEAIVRLRAKLGIRQKELARQLGVTVTSISRYENGKEPATAVLMKLIFVCDAQLRTGDAELDALRGLFEAKRRSDIVSSVKRLASPGTNRGVSVTDLKQMLDGLRLLEGVINGSGVKERVLESAVVHNLLIIVEPYLAFQKEQKRKTAA